VTTEHPYIILFFKRTVTSKFLAITKHIYACFISLHENHHVIFILNKSDCNSFQQLYLIFFFHVSCRNDEISVSVRIMEVLHMSSL
jgi:hypothetical protein